MDNYERQLLTQFLGQLIQTKILTKDLEANSLIRKAFDQQPDAPYLLVQKTMIQDHALQQAQEQIQQLQAEIETLRNQTNVTPSNTQANQLSSFFGNTPVKKNTAQIPSDAQAPAQSSAYAAPQAAVSQGSPWGGFLASAASTAAGVAGGVFLTEGLRSLFGGNSSAHAASSSSQGFLGDSNPGFSSATDSSQDLGNFFENSMGDTSQFMDTDASMSDFSYDNDADILIDDES